MKRLILLILIFATAFQVKAQQNYWPSSIAPGSTSFSPSFRWLTGLTDSTNDFTVAIGTKSYRFYSSVRINNLFLKKTDTASLSNRINKLVYKTDYITPLQYGADPTGVVDATAIFRTMMLAGKDIFITGTYLVSDSIIISNPIHIWGSGKLTTVSNKYIFDINSDGVSIDGISFIGSGRASSTNYVTTFPKQTAIHVFGATDLSIHYKNIKITNVTGINLGGELIDIAYNYASNHSGGLQISNTVAEGCFVGYRFENRAEYSQLSNVKAFNCEVGFEDYGGNNPIVNPNFDNNRAGVHLLSGSNPGHSSITGGSINHSIDRSVWADNEDGGYQFEGVQMIIGDVYITGSDKIIFNNCNIVSTTVTVTSSTNTQMNNCKFDTTPTFTGIGAIVFTNTTWLGTPPTGFNDYIRNTTILPTLPTLSGMGNILMQQQSDGALTKLPYIFYNQGTNTFSTNIAGNSGSVTDGVYTTTFNGLGDPRYLKLTGGTIATGGAGVPLTIQASSAAIGININGRIGDLGYLQFFQNDGTTLEGSINGATGGKLQYNATRHEFTGAATFSSSITSLNSYSTSTTPAIAAGAAAGTSPTVTITGNNQDGVIIVTTGTATVIGTLCTVTMSGAFAYPNSCTPVISPYGSTALSIVARVDIGTVNTTQFTLGVPQTALAASTTYQFTYHNGGY
jgi:hypothetical protein